MKDPVLNKWFIEEEDKQQEKRSKLKREMFIED